MRKARVNDEVRRNENERYEEKSKKRVKEADKGTSDVRGENELLLKEKERGSRSSDVLI